MPNTQQELIPIITKREQLEQWVDARTLHQFLEIGKDFSTWIKDYIADFGFVEGVDFSPNLGSKMANQHGGSNRLDYTLSMDMAKELSMLQRNEKGRQARQYFIAAEKKLRQLEAGKINGPVIANPFQIIFQYCRKQQHEGKTWYAANHLRRLTGRGGHIKEIVLRLSTEGKAKLLPEANQQKWYVTQDAIPDLLTIMPSNLVNVALIDMIKQGGLL